MMNSSSSILYHQEVESMITKWEKRYRNLQNLIDSLLIERDLEDDVDLRRALLDQINPLREERDLVEEAIQDLKKIYQE